MGMRHLFLSIITPQRSFFGKGPYRLMRDAVPSGFEHDFEKRMAILRIRQIRRTIVNLCREMLGRRSSCSLVLAVFASESLFEWQREGTCLG